LLVPHILIGCDKDIKFFLGTSDHGTPLSWQPKPGNYKVIALDDHGRSDACAVTFALAEASGRQIAH